MKILHVFHHYKPCIGGVEKVIEELNKNLSAKGHSCSVLCLNRSPKGGKKLSSKESFGEATVERIPFLDLHFYKFAPFSLKRLKEFDLIHVHGLGFFADYLALTKPFHGKPLVFTTHGGVFHTGKLSILKKVYFYLWGRLLLKSFCRIIAVSEHDRGLFSAVADEGKITLIENGVDWKHLSAIKRNPEKNLFLYFGRLSRNKGLPELVDAFALLCKKKNGCKLVIAGRDFENLLPELENKVKLLGMGNVVSFPGEVSDDGLKKLLSRAEFFVSASSYEGFGIATVEAMSAGLIPLLNRIDSFGRFVRDGENGFFVDFSNKEEAAKQLEKAAGLGDSEKKRMGENAKSFASSFDWAKKALEHEEIYRKCRK